MLITTIDVTHVTKHYTITLFRTIKNYLNAIKDAVVNCLYNYCDFS